MLSQFSTKRFMVSILVVLFIAFGLAPVISANEGQIGHLSIPSIGVEAPILTAPIGNGTWDVSHLHMTVGHLQHLPWFGQASNVVLGGHSLDTEGNPDVFYNLSSVQVGDTITAYAGDQTFTYVVTEIRNVHYQDLSVLYPTNEERLTLITCDSASYNGSSYDRRDVVIATRVS